MTTINVEWLAKAMQRRKLQNPAQLARYAKISRPTACDYVAGRPLARVDMTSVTALATAFGVKNPLRLLVYRPDPK